MSAQTLIFCVGAAKCGTSWLHTYLRGHEACYLRSIKELHYFDALDGVGDGGHIKRASKRLADARAKLESHPEPETNTWLPMLISDLEEWLSRFDGRTANDSAYLDFIGYRREPAQIIGDFTPAYGQVSSAMLKHMSGLCEQVKFIFLMRDPVDRLWSNIRMTGARLGDDAMELSVADYLSDNNPALVSRSDYRNTLNLLQDVIPAENIHIELFERMFTPEALDRLCHFLGIAPEAGAFGNVVHKGRKVTLPSILRAEFQKKLMPQYNFIEDYMGGLPPEWTDRMVNA